jgi:hypothetical protein
MKPHRHFLVAFLSPPSDPFLMMLERELLIIFFVCLAWAYVCFLLIKILLLVVSLGTEYQMDIPGHIPGGPHAEFP